MRRALEGRSRMQGSGGLGCGKGSAGQRAMQAARRPIHRAEDSRRQAAVCRRTACLLGGTQSRIKSPRAMARGLELVTRGRGITKDCLAVRIAGRTALRAKGDREPVSASPPERPDRICLRRTQSRRQRHPGRSLSGETPARSQRSCLVPWLPPTQVGH